MLFPWPYFTSRLFIFFVSGCWFVLGISTNLTKCSFVLLVWPVLIVLLKSVSLSFEYPFIYPYLLIYFFVILLDLFPVMSLGSFHSIVSLCIFLSSVLSSAYFWCIMFSDISTIVGYLKLNPHTHTHTHTHTHIYIYNLKRNDGSLLYS